MKMPKYLGLFICIDNSHKGKVIDGLTLYKEYKAYETIIETAIQIQLDHDEGGHIPMSLTGVGIEKFVTKEQWREQQLNKLI
jgi:hypothetical protein